MARYTQLREFERIRIYESLKQRKSMELIGKELRRNKSTISREIARNSDEIGYLYPRDAQKQTEHRKARYGSKIDRNPLLKAYILAKVHLGWSPNVIFGRWSKENPTQSICAEAIYQFAYHEKNKEMALWKLFPKTKKKRGLVRKRRSNEGILHRISIHERPVEVENRQEIGHYEADLMFNRSSQSSNVVTAIERKSRKVTLLKNKAKHKKKLAKCIGSSAKSYTFDNGKEFALHHTMDIPTFFCDPGSPWQKGSVENMNGLLPRYLPFSLPAYTITQEYLDQIAHTTNNTPRKILGFLTPNEVFMHNSKQKKENGMKSALPAVEVAYQNNSAVALHY